MTWWLWNERASETCSSQMRTNSILCSSPTHPDLSMPVDHSSLFLFIPLQKYSWSPFTLDDGDRCPTSNCPFSVSLYLLSVCYREMYWHSIPTLWTLHPWSPWQLEQTIQWESLIERLSCSNRGSWDCQWRCQQWFLGFLSAARCLGNIGVYRKRRTHWKTVLLIQLPWGTKNCTAWVSFHGVVMQNREKLLESLGLYK